MINKIFGFFQQKKMQIIFYLFIFALLVLHTFFENGIKIDTTTVLLLLLGLLIPYFPQIRKIKYGDFEAEISHAEVKDATKKVDEISQNKDKDPLKQSEIDALKKVAETDLQLALAKARIEIEKKLRLLAEIYLPKEKTHASLRELLIVLRENKIIDQQLADALGSIIPIANRAVHGEVIAEGDAHRLIEAAGKVLDELNFVVIEHALGSMRSQKITKKDVKEYRNGQYKLTTIYSTDKRAEKRVYLLNQVELEALLTSYDEIGEFVVGLVKVDKPRKH